MPPEPGAGMPHSGVPIYFRNIKIKKIKAE